MRRFKADFSPLSAISLTFCLLFADNIYAKQENNDLMSFAILGAIGSLSLACYEGKAPCTLAPGIDTNKLTISLDNGADRSTHHMRLSLGADWKESIYETDNWKVSGRLEASLHSWSSTLNTPLNKSGYIIGVSPVFQYQPKNYTTAYSMIPYIELGGGPHLLDNIVIENDYKSTQFQFGSIFGLGIKNRDFEISYRYLHISNAGIEMPNPGTDFHNLHIGYYF
ncbi:MAG: acyloxyacyl hydrolase [Gammaproteobacteria bacterium]|nr:acyloxyacyl hydrolase [Gammaproteobacteria bacterium]